MIEKQSKYRNQIESLFNIDNPHVMLLLNTDAIELRERGVRCYELCGGMAAPSTRKFNTHWWYVLTGPNSIIAALTLSVVTNYSLTEFLTMYEACDYTLEESFGLIGNNMYHEVSDLMTIREAHMGVDGDFTMDFWYDRKYGLLHFNATAP